MIESTYTLSTTQSTSSNTLSTIYSSITGTNNVTFSLSGIDQSKSTVDKVIVSFYDDRELVFDRSTSGNLSSLSSTTFTETIVNDIVDICHRKVEFYIHRDDGYNENYIVDFSVYRSDITDYNDVNLIKSDFFEVDNNGAFGDTVLLTFESDNPGLVGNNFININPTEFFGTSGANTSSCSTEVGFEDEYDIVNTYKSYHTFNVRRMGCSESEFTVKFRTRIGTDNAIFGSRIYIPAVANTQFIHVSGSLYFDANYPEYIKTINVPIIDYSGSDLRDSTQNVLYTGLYTGIGTSQMPLTGGYFLVDLYDLSGCNTTTLGTSTVTAFINSF